MTKETELTALRASILETEIDLDNPRLTSPALHDLTNIHYISLKRYFELTTKKQDVVDAELTEPVCKDHGLPNCGDIICSQLRTKVSLNGVPALRVDVGTYVGGPLPYGVEPGSPPFDYRKLKKDGEEDWKRATAGFNKPWRTPDAVDHPKHYNVGKFEVIDVIDDWKLGFAEGNAVKYIARAKHKNNELEDLKKARWYLDHVIKLLEPGVPIAELIDRPVAPVSPGEMICQLRITTNGEWKDLPKGTDWGEVIAGRHALRESVEIPLLANYFRTSTEFWIAIRDNFNTYLKSIGRPPLGTPQETT